nr:MAG TPA: L SHAPED TAIL FIBER PROTEIN [Caudoviricetes sp.]
MVNVDELLASAQETTNDDELSFIIDEHMRIIAVPDRGVVLGVEGDKDVNRVRFRMNRYYHGADLSDFQIRINYQNADGDRNYFTVLEKTVEADAFSFIWTVAADATAVKGAVQFVVNCFTADPDGVVQKAYHTTLGVANVLEGLDPYEGGDIPEIVDYLTHLKNDLLIYSGTLVTGAEQSAAAASNSAAEAAKAEQSAKSYANSAGVSAKEASNSSGTAKSSQTAALASERAAKLSETNAGNSASAASNSAAAAGTSERNAKSSATDAASSASAAKSSETKAGSCVTTAASSANAAKSSATDAASSASAASSSAKAAAESAAVAKAAVSTDKTLTFDGTPADAKATGDALAKRYTKAEADKKFVTPNTLPAATANTLGGVKIGTGLTMDDDGRLSAAEQYTLTKEAITAVLGFTPTKITMGTEDLTAGISPLETGTVYLVYSTASSDEAIGDTDVQLPEPEEPVPDEGVAP